MIKQRLALLHSMENDTHDHTQEKVMVDILKWDNDADVIVRKADGTKCHAVFNIFCCELFVDDIYGVIKEEI